jgi:hypothetical protein
MWLRVILTAFALAVVLYLQFGFDIQDWVKNASTPATESQAIRTDGDSSPSR